jgi:hypothetical protein
MRARLLTKVALFCLLTSLASAEVIQKGNLRVSLKGQVVPKTLPREGSAPVRVSLATAISSTGAKGPTAAARA